MKSKTTRKFRELYANLPSKVKMDAKKAYKIFQENASYPGLQYKCVHKVAKIYSVRINLDYRALGVLDGDEIIWSWIGSHQDYDKLLK